MDFEAFKHTIVDTLDKYAPLEAKDLRANHSNFVTKEVSKAIIKNLERNTIDKKIFV